MIPLVPIAFGISLGPDGGSANPTLLYHQTFDYTQVGKIREKKKANFYTTSFLF